MRRPAGRGDALAGRASMPWLLTAVLALATLAFALVACGDDDENGNGNGGDPTAIATGASTEPADELSGDINGDGSSTVFPITEAVAEEFMAEHSGVRITAGIAGTGGGFEKFCAGETDFNDASRAIADDEVTACADAGIEWTEFQVAIDGMAVITNTSNDFVDCLTVEELNMIWAPEAEGTVTNWNQVRPEFPDKGLSLYGPGTDSGTFDYFTDEINGEEGASRADYQASEDDNVLVQGIAGDEGGLGYFGLAYYEENADQLRLLGVDGGAGCVVPDATTVLDGTYAPLSRPLYVYVTNEALARPEVAEFMRFYLTEGPALAEEVGYVRASQDVYDAGLALIP